MSKGCIMAFIAGVAAGGIGVYLYLNEKCEQRIRDEVESVKMSLGFYDKVKEPEEKNNEPGAIEKEHAKYVKLVEDYTNYNKPVEEKTRGDDISKKVVEDEAVKIEYIDPDHFGEIEEYEECFYTFFNDGIMIEGAIRNEEMIIDEPLRLIGDKDEFTPYVGKYEDITLLGVNHNLGEYFEVTFVDEPYHDDEEE